MTDMREKIAALLWKTEAVHVGAPESVARGRTPEAFVEQSPQIRAKWRKYADALIAALPGMVKPLEWEVGDTHTRADSPTGGTYIIESGWADKIGGTRWFSWVHSEHENDGVDPYFHGEWAEGMDAAKDAADAHHVAQIMAAFGIAGIAQEGET